MSVDCLLKEIDQNLFIRDDVLKEKLRIIDRLLAESINILRIIINPSEFSLEYLGFSF